MLNALTVDVEEYFHVEAFASCVSRADWSTFPPRVERNVDTVLDLLDSHNAQATFFIIGYVAEKYPHLVRRIAGAGHEIGCHSYAHQGIYHQSPDEFRSDLRRAYTTLRELSGQPVDLYRAPTFSIVRSTLWALDILTEEGFRLDSSIAPVRHDLYGIPDAGRFPYWRRTPNGVPIFEFPPSTIQRFGRNWSVGGGGWLRIFPYRLTRSAIAHINDAEGMPGLVYIHPWELDADQPRIPAPLRSRVRHYTGLSVMKGKLERLLRDFRFGTLSQVCEQLPAYRAGIASEGIMRSVAGAGR